MWMKPRSTSPMMRSSPTRTFSKNSSAVSDSVWPTLSSLRPRLKPSSPASIAKSVMPLAPFSGEVRTAVTTRSALKPLVMKVLEPLMTQPSPSRTAVVLSAARSEPPPGSVMPIARRISPETMPGSQRSFCSCVPRATMYGAVMSVWMPTQDASAALTLLSSSAKTALKRKSSAPAPPNSSGTSRPSSPSSPAWSQKSRGSDLSSMYCSMCGATFLARNAAQLSRKASWSSV